MSESKKVALATLVSRALMTEWDPIGVKDIPEAIGEYDGYVSKICQLLLNGGNYQRLFDHLWWIETGRMGLLGDRAATEAFVARLLALRDQEAQGRAG